MSNVKAEALANQTAPVPIVKVSYDDVDSSSSEADSSYGRGRAPASQRQNNRDKSVPPSPNTRQSLQDRVFNKLFSQIIPTDGLDEVNSISTDESLHNGPKKPDFSLPVMGNNFRRFNARIGIVFVFQDQAADVLSWKKPTHTLSFLAVFTFVCLDPYLIIALPLAVALLFIMVPAFTSRHPPPPRSPLASSSIRDHSNSAHSYSGPALAPAKTLKPAPETSVDFFRNMRDLQNTMADFSDVHDALVSVIAPATNFSNEVLSSTIFLYLTILTTVLFISAHLIPLRLVTLLGGYAAIGSAHPQVQIFLIKQRKRNEKKAKLQLASPKEEERQSTIVLAGMPISLPNNKIAQTVQSIISSMSEITLSAMSDLREVEIFELQHRPILPALTSAHSTTSDSEIYEWTPHLFTATPFDPLSPARIAGERPRGTRFFEDVQPPAGWEWSSKKWQLDLEAGEWVSERLIVGVEYDAIHNDDNDDHKNQKPSKAITSISDKPSDTTNQITSSEDFALQRIRKQSVNLDFGGWVWDLPPAVGSTGNRDEEVWLAYGDYDLPPLSQNDQKRKDKNFKKGHKKTSSSKGGSVAGSKQDKDWEESVQYGDRERTGEWRRRRWVRVVRRKAVLAEDH